MNGSLFCVILKEIDLLILRRGKKSMKLYFLRHGEAEDMSSAISDHERKLTAKGIERIQTAAKVLSRLRIKPTHIYASPRIRALHTAEIVAKELEGKVEVNEAVNFNFNLPTVETLIAGLDDTAEVLFVGHEPSMSKVVGELTGGNIAMKKGGLARVDAVIPTSPLRGQLIWLIPPKIFDTLDD
jgi:phosphohistidine phosphatase